VDARSVGREGEGRVGNGRWWANSGDSAVGIIRAINKAGITGSVEGNKNAGEDDGGSVVERLGTGGGEEERAAFRRRP
jgi:hypothetical protein